MHRIHVSPDTDRCDFVIPVMKILVPLNAGNFLRGIAPKGGLLSAIYKVELVL